MSTCFTDIELQALAEGEGSPASREHLESCSSCRDRVEARRAAWLAFTNMVAGAETPTGLGARVMTAVARADQASGATTLRHVSRERLWLRRLALPLAAAAAVLLVVFVALPRMGAPTEVSAAEVIGRSLHALGQSSGVERLEYKLRLDGMPSQLLQGIEDPAFLVRQTVDHDHGGFMVARYAPDGTLVAAMAEDPGAGMRTMVVRMKGRRYVARLTLPAGPRLSMLQFGRSVLRTWLGVLQATGSRGLRLTKSSEGERFVVEAPEVAPEPGSAWELASARLVIDAQDYRIIEVDTRGQLLGRPYHVSFALRHRQVDAAAQDGDFTIPAEPGDIVLDGEASDNPMWDVASAALRRLAVEPAAPSGH